MEKYEIKNGIMYHGSKAVFALGSSYYPSFHEHKFPVPPEGDRIGEMKKDLQKMKDFGFSFIRTAALGNVYLDENEDIQIETDFIDDMARECEENDMALSIRLQGYVMNIRNNTDYLMMNHSGEGMDQAWNSFLRSSFFHEGILKDNEETTKALAVHFSKFPSVFSYQIYNEPHYPANGVFDYHPCTIAAYRKWLVKNNIMSADDAENYSPPRFRPKTKEEISEWVNWRMFSMEALSDFLNTTAAHSKAVCPNLDVYTCLTVSSSGNNNADRGENYFDSAEKMDMLGITHYTNFDGIDYISARYTLNLAESAAAIYGKHAWAVELDARTRITARKFFQETVSAIGSAHKGICYYEWRGDYPVNGTPEADNCGILHYDGTKTDSFDENKKVIDLVNRLSDKIIATEKKRCGVAVLHSDYGYAFYDALTDNLLGGINIWQYITVALCRELYSRGYNIDFVRACDLESNPLNVSVLYVPSRTALPDFEVEMIDSFVKKGGKVYYEDTTATFEAMCAGGFWEWNNPPKNRVRVEFKGGMDIDDTLELAGVKPFVTTNHHHMFSEILEGNGYHIVTLINNSTDAKPIVNQPISLGFKANSATLYTKNNEIKLDISNTSLTIPQLDDAAIIILE